MRVHRWPWAGIVASSVTLLVLACAPAKQELLFWQFWPAEIVQPLLDRFERQHPRIHVRMEQLDWASGLQRITAALEAGTMPDLCEMGSTWMPRMLASGRLSDWSAGVADLKPALRGWALCSVGDAVYGLPWMLGTRALFYNKALLARAGLDSSRAPETWAELYAAAEAVQKLGGEVRGYGVQSEERGILFKKFMPYAWGNGGRILSDDLQTSVFDSPQNRESLEFYLSLRRVGLVDRQDALDRAFKSGTLGLQISGAWLLRSIPKEAPRLRFGVALVPRPAAERGTHASFAGGELLVSFNGSKHKQAALELARYLVEPEQMLALAVATQSAQPAWTGADTAAYYRAHPEQQLMLRQFETAVPTPNHPAWMDMEAAIEDEVGRAILDHQDAAAAVAAADQRIAELLESPPR